VARYPYARADIFIDRLDQHRPAIVAAAKEASRHPVADVVLRSPVLNPGKIVAAPVNYRKHLEEAIAEQKTFSVVHVRQIHETGLFLKATSSLIGAGSVNGAQV
jgi:2,4-didehydro-3-deoxy-L-rhamnonate hydrolase